MRRIFENLLSLSTQQMVLLGLLGLGAFLQSVSFVWLDSLATGLYIGTFGRIDLSFLFIVSAFFLGGAGFWSVFIERKSGRGLNVFLIVALFIQLVLLLTFVNGIKISLDALFVMKFSYRLLLTVGFWSLVFRFVPLNLHSKKFLFFVMMDFLGVIFGGISISLLQNIANASSLLLGNIILGVVLIGLFWQVCRFEKNVPQEAFHKNGGVNEPAQVNLMLLIYCASFLYSAVRCFVDYILCIELSSFDLVTVALTLSSMGMIWAIIGFVSLSGLIILYASRSSLSILHGMSILSLLPMIVYLGWVGHFVWLVFFAKIVFEVISYFCVGYYFRMIPRPLTHGHGHRMKVYRLSLLEPAGFCFSAIVFYFCANQMVWGYLAVFFVVTCCATIYLTKKEYANVLLSSFKTFRWRGGRLLIITPKVIDFITKKAASPNPDEAVYFLRVLEDAQYANYVNFIRRALKHPHTRVRAFALERIEKNQIMTLNKIVSDLLNKDDSLIVRQKALRVLCASGEKYSQEKAILYLEDSQLKKGALIGLLRGGGEGILIASEGVNKLVSSHKTEDRLQAAEILEESAIKGFYRLVLILTKDKDLRVRKLALLAAGRIAHPLLLPSLFKALENMELRDCALQALRGYESKAYSAIEQALINEKTSLMIKRTLVSFLCVSEDSNAQKLLINILPHVSFFERLNILRHLKEEILIWSFRKKKRILCPLIDKDSKQALIVLQLLEDFMYTPTHEAEEVFSALRDSLEAEFAQIRESVLLELYFFYSSGLIKRAIDLLLLPSEKRAGQESAALGVIEDVLPRKWKSLKMLIKETPIEERLEKSSVVAETAKCNLTQQLANVISTPAYHNTWTQACALMCVRKTGNVALLPYVLESMKNHHPLMRESSVWALGRMGLKYKELKQYLKSMDRDSNVNVQEAVRNVIKKGD